MLYSTQATHIPEVGLASRADAVSLSRPTVLVLAVILVGSSLRLWASHSVGLGYGESYHFSCAIRPNLSYFDHPPLSIWMSALSMRLCGSREALAIRLPFVLMFAGTTWMTYWLGRRFFGEWAGFYAALLLNLSAVFTLSVAVFLQPDGPLMFFWMATTCCLARIFFDRELERPMLWWCLVGLCLGLTALSKYHAVFIVFGAGMYALTVPDARKWIAHPGPYLAILIAAAVFAPVIVWNNQHHWISILWQGSRGLDNHGVRLDWLVRNIGGQALWLLPWIWAPLLWELPKCFWAGRADKERWFIAWMAVAPIVLFTAVSAYASIGFHFHWQAPGYLMLFLPLGATLEQKLAAGSRVSRWWLRGTFVVTVASLFIVGTHAATGWWRSVGPAWLSEKFGEPDDPTLEMLDYHTLAAALAERGLADRTDLFLVTNRWFQSGKVDYALAGRMPVLCLNWKDPRGFAFWDQTADWLGKNAVIVSTKKFLSDPVAEYHPYFDSIEPLGTVSVPRGGHVEETLYLHLCHNLKTEFPMPYGPGARVR